jgi:O-antigen/teichoic acid export membrane protein
MASSLLKEKSIKGNIAINSIRTIITAAFPLVTFPYVARVLMPEGIGIVTFASTIASYFVVLSSFGIPAYGVRQVAQNRNNPNELNKIIHELFIINMVCIVISYALLTVCIVLDPALYKIRLLVIITSSIVLFTAIGFEWVYTGLEQYSFITLRGFVFQVISLIALFVFVRKKDDVIAYAVITVISSVGSNVLNIIFLKKTVPISKVHEYNFRRHFKSAGLFFLMAFFSNVLAKLDNIMLGRVSGYQSVGLYSSANRIMSILFPVLGSMGQIFVTRLSFYSKNNFNDKYDDALNKSFSSICFIAIPAVIGLELLSKEIILVLMGIHFIEAVSIFQVLAPTALFSLLTMFFANQVLYSNEKDQKMLWGIIFNSIASIVFNILLIPSFNDIGAAVANLLTAVVGTACFGWLSRGFLKNLNIQKALYKPILASCLMAAVVLFEKTFITSILQSLIVCIVTGSLVYFVGLLILRNDIACMIFDVSKNLLLKMILGIYGHNKKRD